ncbi:hypothetical protein [Mucilaginibacter phyllosphaerae]
MAEISNITLTKVSKTLQITSYVFDRSDFIYTGVAGKNMQIMSFRNHELATYKSSDLQYPQNLRMIPISGKD